MGFPGTTTVPIVTRDRGPRVAGATRALRPCTLRTVRREAQSRGLHPGQWERVMTQEETYLSTTP